MARSITRALIMDRMGWENESLMISVAKMKNDQEGQNSFPRHIYANSNNPAICPILSLALLVFSRFTRNAASRLLTRKVV